MKAENKKRIICIGAGASGSFFALNCSDSSHEVLLFDSNAKMGRKMYISGKGRCNITNDCDVRTFIANINNNPRFLYSAINRFSPADTIAFFNEHGCPLKTERGNRVFPVSDHSSDIIDCLYREGKRNKVLFHFSEEIKEVEKRDDRFLVTTGKAVYEADALVVATGGLSYPVTGSTGFGYRIAEQFGHTLIEPRSALCPIKVREEIPKQLLKLTLKNVSLTAVSGKFRKTIFGDLEFLEKAISGPVTLSMSSLINRFEEVKLELDLKPALDEDKLDKRLLREMKQEPRKDLEYLIKQLLPHEFCDMFLAGIKADRKTVLSEMSKQTRQQIIQRLKHFPLTYDGLETIDKSIVTSGGVAVGEVDPKTMESKLCKGLYFIGEVLDVDGFTGGFNLQSALSTGYVCAQALKEE